MFEFGRKELLKINSLTVSKRTVDIQTVSNCKKGRCR